LSERWLSAAPRERNIDQLNVVEVAMIQFTQ
jgi:hypothetical protein